MKKETVVASWLVWLILAISLCLAILFYPQMPDQMASHWNIKGEVDGYLPKFWALFLAPLVIAGIGALFTFIPRMDPLKKNIDAFRGYYNGFIAAIAGLVLLLQMYGILWHAGVQISPNRVIPVAIGGLLYYAGVMMTHTKRNWFIGIRTPWTLSSDKVWEKTHKIGGRLFKMSGIIALFGLLLPNLAVWLLLIPIFLSVIYTVFYSYTEYNRGKSP